MSAIDLNLMRPGPPMDTDATIAAMKAKDGGYTQSQPKISDYFAAADSETIAQELQAKVEKYYSYIISSNLVELWRRSYRAYYGMRQSTGASGWGVFDVGQLVPSGDQGEIVRVKVNHFANLITHQVVMTTGQRPALECRAVNADASSLVAASLGDGIAEYFMRERRLERNYFQAIETAVVVSEGYVVLGWDATAGKQYGAGPNGSVQYDGDLTAKNFTPFDMVKDTTKSSDDDETWYITVGKKNKYDLMAKYPHLAEQIDGVTPDEMIDAKFGDPSRIIAGANRAQQESDDISYKEFYHDITDAMPDGRYTIFINGDICLFDGPLPFRALKDVVHRVTPKNIIGTPFGWTDSFDVLALQELVDKLYTVVATNVLGTGVSNFWSPPGNEVTVSQIAGGMNLIESMVKPEVLDLLMAQVESTNFINKIEAVMQTLKGVSSINRGDMPSSDMSGSAMAFMASQAITFNSGLQSGANQLLESMGTGMMHILQDYATTPRIAIIAGKQNRTQMKTYMGKDLAPINNVVCDATSALSKTLAGKLSIADNLLKAGMVPTAQEYLTLIKTGQMEPLTRAPVMENFLIQAENEELLQGINPPVLRTDMHKQHIAEHKTVISTPDSRRDPKITVPTLQHIADHEAMDLQMQQQDPAYLAATDQPPLPFPTPPPQPQPPQGQPPPGPGGPPGAPGGIAATTNPANPIAQQAAKTRQPNMPNLPKGTDQQTQASFQQIGGK